VYLLPVLLSAQAAKKDFQSGKSLLALIICRYFYFSYAEGGALTVNSIWFGREKKLLINSINKLRTISQRLDLVLIDP
jgi:hypothetical protein